MCLVLPFILVSESVKVLELYVPYPTPKFSVAPLDTYAHSSLYTAYKYEDCLRSIVPSEDFEVLPPSHSAFREKKRSQVSSETFVKSEISE